MSKSLVKYQRNLPARSSSISTGTIVGIIVIGVIIWFLLRRKPGPIAGQYHNAETWSVSYNEDGLPTKIEIHREATRT